MINNYNLMSSPEKKKKPKLKDNSNEENVSKDTTERVVEEVKKNKVS